MRKFVLKKVRLLLVVLLALALIICNIPLTARADTTGDFGEVEATYNIGSKNVQDVKATLYSSQILVISGSGDMKNFDLTNNRVPWNNYKSTIQGVIVESGVTSIGNYALANLISLETVKLPEGLTKINLYAFSGCKNFTGVIAIPSSVKSVDQYAFNNCQNAIIFCPDVGSWSTHVFDGCSAGTTVYTSATSNGNWLYNQIKSSYSLTQGIYETSGDFYVVPNSENHTAQIGGYFGTSTEIAIPETVEDSDRTVYTIDEIMPGTFAYSEITSVTIPNTVEKIDSDAFQSCKQLETVLDGNGVTYIGESAFEQDSLVTLSDTMSNIVTVSDKAFSYAGTGDLHLLNVVSIGENAFECSNYKVYIGDKLSSIQSNSFAGATNRIKIPENDDSLKAVLNGLGILYDTYTPLVVASVSLDSNSITIEQGKTHQFTATVSPADAPDKSVSWASTNPTVGTISGDGLFAALEPGTTTVSVITNSGNKSAECIVTVTEQAVTVSGISAPDMSLEIGQEKQINAAVEPENAINKNLSYTISDSSIAVVNEEGKITGKAVGSATVTLTATDGSSVTAAFIVTVTEPEPVSLTLTPSTDQPTNGSVTITAKTTGNVKELVLPSGVSASAGTFTYNVSTNGTYTFVAKGADGNDITKTIEISNIDKIAPTLKVNSKMQETSSVYTVDAVDSESGIDMVILPDGTEVAQVDLPCTYSQTEDGTVTIIAVDKAGNRSSKEYSRNSVQISGGTSTTFLAFEGIPKEWTNKPADITLAAINSKDKVSMNVEVDSNTQAVQDKALALTEPVSAEVVTKTVKMDQNGNINVLLTDGDGNTCTKQLTVDKIDTQIPDISGVEEDNQYTIDASDALSGVKSITDPAGNVTDGNTASFTAAGNPGSLPFLVEDNAGNVASYDAVTGDITNETPDNPSNPDDGSETQSADVEVIGTVDTENGNDGGGGSSDVIVTIPTKIAFEITSDRQFVAPDFVVSSDTAAPVTIKVAGITKQNGTIADIVSPDQYPSWDDLTEEETNAGIALKVGNAWLNETGSVMTTLPASTGETVTESLPVTAKFGKSWGNSEKIILQYTLSLKIE